MREARPESEYAGPDIEVLVPPTHPIPAVEKDAAVAAATMAAAVCDDAADAEAATTAAAAAACVEVAAAAGVCHWMAMYGQLKDPPLRSMSLIRVSMGVLPTSRTKNSCSITWADTDRSDGSRRRSFPNRVGWLGYWLRTYSSRAHWDFSWILSICAMSDKPQASAKDKVR